ncbi:MAG: SelB C-terminal domain-containing protein [Chloroflexi bacterium]|nr:SelB C-terminal domain-containing protein [Chloroflexota bacterium]MCK4243158.1 SelB C-terminal domain-containing protein [Dehalococcoidia bacterium]
MPLAEVRDLSSTSRKSAQVFLEHFDEKDNPPHR